MKRIPLIPTFLVALACAAMIGLGIWQLQRAKWKEGLLADYAAAANLPAIAYPSPPWTEKLPLFRKSGLFCLSVEKWEATAGRSAAGTSGWAHLALCRTGTEGPGALVNVGWSKSPASPDWKGGEVTGVIAPDTRHKVRLVSDRPLTPGLQASMPPSLDDVPNNHFGYAIQWFLFAGVAALIFGLALKRRMKTGAVPE